MGRHGDVPLILISETDCCFRCPDAGVHLTLPLGTPFAVLPLSETRAQSHGLMWDLDEVTLSPKGLVSSSNRTAAEAVLVKADDTVIITLPLAHLPQALAAVSETSA